MERIGDVPSKVLEFYPNTLYEVRKLYNLDQPSRMDEAINILEEWIKKQDHFMKKDFSRDFLERVIIFNKGQLERAKKKLDAICTRKMLMSQYFGVYNVKDFKELSFVASFALPKQTPDNSRIFLFYFESDPENMTATTWKMFYRKSFVGYEFLQRFDYCDGFILIFDARHIMNVMNFLNSINLNEANNIVHVYQKGYGARVKAIHLITTSTWINTGIGILKQLLGAKLASRIYAHEALDTLHDLVPKNILPEEYGGQEMSIKKLNENWLDQISSEDHLQYLKTLEDMKTDESRRSDVKFNEQYLGTPGTFRNLVVD